MGRNYEGYPDPTAGAAVGKVMKEYRKEQRDRQRREQELKERKTVYVASRYAGDTEANVTAARRYMRFAVEQGVIPVASHVLYHGIIREETEREVGTMYGLALLSFCDEVWCFGEPSPGMVQEIREAERLGKPVRYFGMEVAG